MNERFARMKVLTVVRAPSGAKLPEVQRRVTVVGSCAAEPAPPASHGLPIKAIQNCCGRGCKHCRVYWRRWE